MRRTMDESLLRHPEIVVHLGEIFVARVGDESDDALRFRLLPAITQRAGHERAGG